MRCKAIQYNTMQYNAIMQCHAPQCYNNMIIWLPVMTSPDLTGPTPAGVPVKIKSPSLKEKVY